VLVDNTVREIQAPNQSPDQNYVHKIINYQQNPNFITIVRLTGDAEKLGFSISKDDDRIVQYKYVISFDKKGVENIGVLTG
jgi:hypothetical protein